MKRSFSLFTLVLIAALRVAAAEQHGQLDVSPTLFSVLAAINAAGYDTDLASAANHPLRGHDPPGAGREEAAVSSRT